MKNKISFKLLLMIMALTCSVLVTACGSVNKKEKVITVDGISLNYDEVALSLRVAQYTEQAMARMQGFDNEEMWETEVEGKKMKDLFKENEKKNLENILVLASKADEYSVTLTEEDKTKAENDVKSSLEVIEQNEELKKFLDINVESLTNLTEIKILADKVRIAMTDKIEVDSVKEEDARVAKAQVVFIEVKEDNIEAARNESEELIMKLRDGEEIESAIKEHDYPTNEITVSVGEINGNQGAPEDIVNSILALKAGETADAIEIKDPSGEKITTLIVAKSISENDEAASDNRKSTLEMNEKNKKFADMLAELLSNAKVEVNDKVFNKIEVKYFKETVINQPSDNVAPLSPDIQDDNGENAEKTEDK